YGLHLAYPNPFNAATVIPFTIPDGVGSATVRLTIHDLLGQRVRTLVQGTHPPGRQQVLWDGLSDDGKGMATGVYLVRLEVGSTRRAQKILYVRQEWVGPLFCEAFHEACPNCLEQIVV
ncbi:MAG: FlgD immunoglobulin-like domain containing protein, partial [Candidatus Latescibacterota bacterium]|nr:FlgD immunoglobulin-like domain containing protein [Candidatus Latescibacterota bacterium]